MRHLLLGTLAMILAGPAVPPKLRSEAESLPVQRLADNLEAALKKDRKNAELRLGLARVHYLAFVNHALALPVRNGTDRIARVGSRDDVHRYLVSRLIAEAKRRARAKLGIDSEAELDAEAMTMLSKVSEIERKKLVAADWTPKIDTRVMRQHAELALRSFDMAIALRGDDGLYRLGRASLCEQVLQFEEDGKLPGRRSIPGFAEMRWADVRDAYRDAFVRARREDRGPGPLFGDVVFEAADGYLRTVDRDEELRVGQAQWLNATRAATAKGKRRAGKLTPIVFGDRADRRLTDLLQLDSNVRFDFDGDGEPETCGWVRPDTHLLVWDPDGSGDIRSGRQLFGSATWFLFHTDGYAALRLLDDDRDGRLLGQELEGLAVWTDRDGDGVSDAGEVVPLWRAGVAAVELAARRDARGVLTAASGLRFCDGRVLPTFDWETTRR